MPTPSIALGTSEVSPLELTGAYAPFANGGMAVIPHVIEQHHRRTTASCFTRAGLGFGRVIDPHDVGDDERDDAETFTIGTAKKAALPGWQAAGKTGTSQDFRDAWFVGYTDASRHRRLARQ